MKLLLKKDIRHLGLIGDVVEVSQGYARNYLIPQGLALQPTPSNIKKIEEARLLAEEQRKKNQAARQAAADRLSGTEVTIKAAANEEGVLYGSVGPREIAAALREEGHVVDASNIELHKPIRHLDNVLIPVIFDEDLTVEVKVWIVREAGSEQYSDEPAETPEQGEAIGTEAMTVDQDAAPHAEE